MSCFKSPFNGALTRPVLSNHTTLTFVLLPIYQFKNKTSFVNISTNPNTTVKKYFFEGCATFNSMLQRLDFFIYIFMAYIHTYICMQLYFSDNADMYFYSANYVLFLRMILKDKHFIISLMLAILFKSFVEQCLKLKVDCFTGELQFYTEKLSRNCRKVNSINLICFFALLKYLSFLGNLPLVSKVYSGNWFTHTVSIENYSVSEHCKHSEVCVK